jgi:hypothetical protein
MEGCFSSFMAQSRWSIEPFRPAESAVGKLRQLKRLLKAVAQCRLKFQLE